MRQVLLMIAALVLVSGTAHAQERVQSDLTRETVDTRPAIQRLASEQAPGAQGIVQEILIVADTTVGTQYFLYSQPGEGAFAGITRSAVRFTPSFDGQIIYVGYFLAGGDNNPRGAGRLRVSLAGTHDDGGWITPAGFVDSVDVDFGEMRDGDVNFLSTAEDADWEVRKDDDFFITFEAIPASDSSRIDFVVDGGSADASNDRYFPARTVLYGDLPPPNGGWLYRFQDRNNQIVAVAVANLLAPELIAPADSSAGIGEEVALIWNAARRADTYRIQVSSDRTFDDIQLEYVTTDTTQSLDSLSASMRYWWRVRGENDLGESPWSRANWFDTSTEIAAEQPAKLDQLHLEVFPNPAPFHAQITLRLETGGPVRIDAFDALGRNLGAIFDGVLAPGVHGFEWKTALQPPGLLFLRAEAGGRSTVRSVMIP